MRIKQRNLFYLFKEQLPPHRGSRLIGKLTCYTGDGGKKPLDGNVRANLYSEGAERNERECTFGYTWGTHNPLISVHNDKAVTGHINYI